MKPLIRKPLILLLAIAAIAVISHFVGLGHRLILLRDYIGHSGIKGMLLFVGIYAVAVVALVPASALTIAAGALFGSIAGVIIVSAASTLGAGLAFLVSRYFLRQTIKDWLGEKEQFRRIESLTQKHGAIIVGITRLIPLFPFTLLNYAFGLTNIRFITYLFWSWLCMLPGTVLYVVGTDAVVHIIAGGRFPWVLVGIVVIFIIIIYFLVRRARSSLSEKS